jgi:hypothetical protein
MTSERSELVHAQEPGASTFMSDPSAARVASYDVRFRVP